MFQLIFSFLMLYLFSSSFNLFRVISFYFSSSPTFLTIFMMYYFKLFTIFDYSFDSLSFYFIFVFHLFSYEFLFIFLFLLLFLFFLFSCKLTLNCTCHYVFLMIMTVVKDGKWLES